MGNNSTKNVETSQPKKEAKKTAKTNGSLTGLERKAAYEEGHHDGFKEGYERGEKMGRINESLDSELKKLDRQNRVLDKVNKGMKYVAVALWSFYIGMRVCDALNDRQNNSTEKTEEDK